MLREELGMGEQWKIKNAKGAKKDIEKRKQAFMDGEDEEVHKLKDASEAIKLISEQDDLIAKHVKRLTKIQLTLENCEKMRATPQPEWRRMAIDDLIQKYCVNAYYEKVKEFRK